MLCISDVATDNTPPCIEEPNDDEKDPDDDANDGDNDNNTVGNTAATTDAAAEDESAIQTNNTLSRNQPSRALVLFLLPVSLVGKIDYTWRN